MSARSSLSQAILGATDTQEATLDYRPVDRAKRTSLAQIAIPSFSAFKDRASSIPVVSQVRRKPLPKNASPRALSYSQCGGATTAAVHDANDPAHTRAFSIDSPLPQLSTGLTNVPTPPLTANSHQDQSSDVQQ